MHILVFDSTIQNLLRVENYFFFVISGFRREVNENCPLQGYYAASSGNSLSTFRENLLVPSSRAKKIFLTLEDVNCFDVLRNISFKEYLPEDGHNEWLKHVRGYVVYTKINLQI